MPVAVNQPNRKGTGLEAIAQALQIANSAYGIKTDMAQLDKLKADEAYQKQLREDKAKGIYSREDTEKDYQVVPLDTPNAQKRLMRTDIDQVQEVGILPRPKEQAAVHWQKDEYIDPKTGATKRGLFNPVTKEFARSPDDPIVKLPEPKKRDTADRDRDDKLTTDLRKEYEDQATTKKTRALLEGYTRIQAVVDPNEELTPQDGMAIIYNFMNTMDPGARLTDSDFTNAQNTKGLPEEIREAYQTFKTGNPLNSEQAQRFIATSKKLMKGQLETQRTIDNRYRSLAKNKYNLDPAFVVDDEFETVFKGLGKSTYGPGFTAEGAPVKPQPSAIGLQAPVPRPQPSPAPTGGGLRTPGASPAAAPTPQPPRRKEWTPPATTAQRR